LNSPPVSVLTTVLTTVDGHGLTFAGTHPPTKARNSRHCDMDCYALARAGPKPEIGGSSPLGHAITPLRRDGVFVTETIISSTGRLYSSNPTGRSYAFTFSSLSSATACLPTYVAMRVKGTALVQTGSGAVRLNFDHGTRATILALRSTGSCQFASLAPLRTTIWFQCSKSVESGESSQFQRQAEGIKSSKVEPVPWPPGGTAGAGSQCDASGCAHRAVRDTIPHRQARTAYTRQRSAMGLIRVRDMVEVVCCAHIPHVPLLVLGSSSSTADLLATVRAEWGSRRQNCR
jgi:hypothetical protein